jgi:hypothetical protein
MVFCIVLLVIITAFGLYSHFVYDDAQKQVDRIKKEKQDGQHEQ